MGGFFPAKTRWEIILFISTGVACSCLHPACSLAPGLRAAACYQLQVHVLLRIPEIPAACLNALCVLLEPLVHHAQLTGNAADGNA